MTSARTRLPLIAYRRGQTVYPGSLQRLPLEALLTTGLDLVGAAL